jgi:hypothetical protein
MTTEAMGVVCMEIAAQRPPQSNEPSALTATRPEIIPDEAHGSVNLRW